MSYREEQQKGSGNAITRRCFHSSPEVAAGCTTIPARGLGGNTLTSAMTRASAEALKLAVGDDVTAIIKSTEVIIGK
jgi:molybdopterin-binding protein